VLKNTFRLICQLNSRCAGRKSNTFKQIIAYLLAGITSYFIRAAIRTSSLTRPKPRVIDDLATSIQGKYEDLRGQVEAIAAHVYENIGYYSPSIWTHPSHIIRLGVGDCKNQASLLQALFERCGIASELIVGVTNRLDGMSDVHAWVRVEIDGVSLICDSTISGKAMDVAEYENAVSGLVDITPEYLLKEPISVTYGVGKLSYR